MSLHMLKLCTPCARRHVVGALGVLASLSASPAAAIELRGTVFWLDETNDRQAAAEIEVRVQETRATTVTDSTGFFRVALPAAFAPGQSVTLAVAAGERVIFHPPGGEVRIPADPSRALIEVELVRKGSMRLLSDERLEERMDQMASELAQRRLSQTEEAGEREPDLTRLLRQWAEAEGFGLAEVQRELDRWSREILGRSEDSHQRGLAKLAQRDYSGAADEFAASATRYSDELDRIEAAEADLSERKEEVRQRILRDREAEYGAAIGDLDFERAVRVARRLSEEVSRSRDALAWARYQNHLANALLDQGIRSPADISGRLLRESVAANRAALEVFRREGLPQDWAATQNNLGAVLSAQSRRTPGAESIKLLSESVAAYRAALEVYTREELPQSWATTQNNLGNVLAAQGLSTSGAESAGLLSESVAAYRAALEVFTREELPQKWATTQNNLGNVLKEQGQWTSGAESVGLLSESVAAYRAALEVLNREELPQNWAMTQNNLGLVLQEQGLRTSGAESPRLLSESIAAYRAALEVFTREELPQDWAATQNNVGNVLQEKGLRTAGEESLGLLSESVAAYRAALEVFTREELPQSWATTQNNLGNVLQGQGRRMSGEEGARLLSKSAAAYRAALEVRTQEELPQNWALTQNNLGLVLQAQGLRSSGEASVRLLSESAAAYREALEVFTREEMPQAWATTQNNLGSVLKEQGLRSSGEESSRLLSEAVAALRTALEVRTQEELPQDWAATQSNLGNVLQEQGLRMSGEEGAGLLADSLAAYRAALEVVTRAELPGGWVMIRRNEGYVLVALGEFEQAADAFREVLQVEPHDQRVWHRLTNLLHNQLRDFEGAQDVVGGWLELDDAEPVVVLYAIECYFTNRQAVAGLEWSAPFRSLAGNAYGARLVGLGYDLANLLALDRIAEVQAALDALTDRVARFPADFEPIWTYEGTRHYLETTPELPNREALRLLFEALEAPGREEVLEGLESVRRLLLAGEEGGLHRDAA